MISRFEVEYRPEAISDIDKLYFSVFLISYNLRSADRFLARLLDRCDRIGFAPNGGSRCGPPKLLLRFVPFERSAIVVYRADAGLVEIVRVFSSRTDYLSVLAEMAETAP